ncbi:MAG: glycosyltransferase N-terminal domain-containing protein [Desulfobaccales bacterium]
MSDNTLINLAYQGLSTLAGLFGWPFFYWHLKSRGRGESFRPRLGLDLPGGPPPGQPRLWLHAISVGEILAALPLIRELKSLFPGAALIVSTGTETGQALARKHFLPLGARVCYFPLDIPWTVERYLERLQPQLVITLESEIWPNFLNMARQSGILLVLANARVSEQSFRRYIRYRRYAAELINNYDLIIAGAPLDHQRLLAVGLDPAKMRLSGNLKCDRLFQDRNEAEAAQFQRLLQGGQAHSGGPPVWLAASTHAGEEEIVLDAYKELLGPYPSLLLVLAPRHPERAPGLLDNLVGAKFGLTGHLWSRLKADLEVRTKPVVLIDTIGDLFSLYGSADVAFVGGSLVPHGGQNILEAAAWGRAPLYGPNLSNFLWALDILEADDSGAGIRVADAASLAAAVDRLLRNPELRRDLGARAQATLIPHQGAARRQAELIAGLWRQQAGRSGQRRR